MNFPHNPGIQSLFIIQTFKELECVCLCVCVCAHTHTPLGFWLLWKNTISKSNLGRKLSISAYSSTLYSIIGEGQGRNSDITGVWMMEFVHRPWGSDLLGLLSYSTQTYQPRSGTDHYECRMMGHPTSIKKMNYRLAHSPVWLGHFLSCVKLMTQN